MQPYWGLIICAFLAPAAEAEWTQAASLCATIADDHERAIYHCTLAINADVLDLSEFALTYNNRAYEYIATDKLELALDDANESIRLDNTNPSAWNQQGRVFQLWEDYTRAINSYVTALEHLDYDNADISVGYGTELAANFNIATCYTQLDAQTRARPYVERAFELAPDDPQAQQLYRQYGLK